MSDEIDDLISSIDSQLGKTSTKRSRSTRAQKKDFSALERLASAKGQITRMDMSEEEFESYREMLIANELSKHMDLRPSWMPVARLTYVIKQRCETCGDEVRFIGGEYIRFRSKAMKAVITRRAEVCTDLIHYTSPDYFLEDLIEEIDQSVARCPGCLKVEEMAWELWRAATTVEPMQFDLPEVEKKPYVSLTGSQLESYVKHEFGERWRKPKPKDDLEIDL